MNKGFLITITRKADNEIRLFESSRQTSYVKKYIRNIFIEIMSSEDDLPCNSRSYFIFPPSLKEICDNIENSINSDISDKDVPVQLTDNTFYHFGWKQLYNRFFFLDIDQKQRDLQLYKKNYYVSEFYPLNDLICLINSVDTEFSMTAFSFILFSATKSLYKAPINSSIKDIDLYVIPEQSNSFEICLYLNAIAHTIVKRSIHFDYNTGEIMKDLIKEFKINEATAKYTKYRVLRYKIKNGKKIKLANPKIIPSFDREHFNEEKSKITRKTYTYVIEDYPILVYNKNNSKHAPSKLLNINSASKIYINCIDNSTHNQQNFISVFPTCIKKDYPKVIQTNFLKFLEDKLSDLAEDKYIDKRISENLQNEINKIIDQNTDPIQFYDLSIKEINRLTNCIYRKCFHKNQKITYFDDLYAKAKKQLSFPDSDPNKVQTYSYLLASLMSFKEYVDDLPNKNYIALINSPQENSFEEDDEGPDDYEENSPPPKPPITDITPYKEEFYTLFDQTVDIFKKRCAVNDTADHTISYEDKLILYFEQFITELQNAKSNLIIPPAKEKQDLIFLNFHSYFEHFELFLEKKNFHYTISKQKFNRLLFDNKILKPRYNGSDKTPPKFDYILQVNEQKYTVIAIKLEMLKSKCDELSKCP